MALVNHVRLDFPGTEVPVANRAKGTDHTSVLVQDLHRLRVHRLGADADDAVYGKGCGGGDGCGGEPAEETDPPDGGHVDAEERGRDVPWGGEKEGRRSRKGG